MPKNVRQLIEKIIESWNIIIKFYFLFWCHHRFSKMKKKMKNEKRKMKNEK